MASFSTSLTSSASGSLKLDIDEVRSQLLELGYPPMDDDQLRQFARDLKKLMKYELKHQRRQNYSTDSKSAEQTDGGLATSKDYSKDDSTDDEECTTSEDVVVRVIEKKSVGQSGNKKQKVERPKKSVILPRIDSKVQSNARDLLLIQKFAFSAHYTALHFAHKFAMTSKSLGLKRILFEG